MKQDEGNVPPQLSAHGSHSRAGATRNPRLHDLASSGIVRAWIIGALMAHHGLKGLTQPQIPFRKYTIGLKHNWGRNTTAIKTVGIFE